ncbi:phospho-sugar mutase [Arthrobacter sp. JSM 101049]|uniref:phospho-sugar mutase n=1 Tax=Arthrobacter sp. JSM 101049 TaxID=929097 RepID=UPI0035666C2C
MNPAPEPSGDLFARAEAWAAEDPDPATATELRELLATDRADDAARAELADRFAGTLSFGTAGLRAALGAGPNRMNRVVVRHTAAGLARYLLDTAAGAYTPRAVIGFDARYNSDIFAEETAAVFTAAGIEAFLMPSRLPTPVLAWAVRALECEAGVMVTASHNPPQDNGYKVYLGGQAVTGAGQGAQIVTPLDADIAERISASGPLSGIDLAADGWTVLPGAGAPGDVQARYLEAITALVPADEAERGRRAGLRIVLTPMHGVGGDTMSRAFSTAGFPDVRLVPEQAEPDPDFPTVAFPNPEEPGAIDLALALARKSDADLVIANDPDADRCAAAVNDPAAGWRMLTGDEVGALLGVHVAARLAGTATASAGSATPAASPVFANSIVSSRLLARIAADAGIAHETTLTGFKWISRVPGLAFGYEEALGYCVAPGLVRDKDGMSAALLLAEFAAGLKSTGRTLLDELDALALAHGLHATDQLSVRVASLVELGTLMTRLRSEAPASFSGSPVTTAEDLGRGSGQLPPTDAMRYTTADGSRVIVRPSGTEPKLKCYLEVIEPVASPDDLPAARQRAGDRLAGVRADTCTALGL